MGGMTGNINQTPSLNLQNVDAATIQRAAAGLSSSVFNTLSQVAGQTPAQAAAFQGGNFSGGFPAGFGGGFQVGFTTHANIWKGKMCDSLEICSIFFVIMTNSYYICRFEMLSISTHLSM